MLEPRFTSDDVDRGTIRRRRVIQKQGSCITTQRFLARKVAGARGEVLFSSWVRRIAAHVNVCIRANAAEQTPYGIWDFKNQPCNPLQISFINRIHTHKQNLRSGPTIDSGDTSRKSEKHACFSKNFKFFSKIFSKIFFEFFSLSPPPCQKVSPRSSIS